MSLFRTIIKYICKFFVIDTTNILSEKEIVKNLLNNKSFINVDKIDIIHHYEVIEISCINDYVKTIKVYHNGESIEILLSLNDTIMKFMKNDYEFV